MIDFGGIATAVVTVLAPFMPFLIGMGKAAGQKFTDTMTEKGGEAAWQKAQTLWSRLKAHFGDDPVISSAATLVADEPSNDTFQKKLAVELGKHLKEKPELAKEISDLLGGQEAIATQLQVAKRQGMVKDVNQLIENTVAKQIAYADEGGQIVRGSQTVRSKSSSSS